MTDELNGHAGEAGPPGPATAAVEDPGAARRDLGVVRMRRLVEAPIEVSFALAPGDRALVAAGESVVPGAPIIERVRDPRMSDVVVPPASDPAPGGRIPDGELLFEWRDRWRVAYGEVTEPLDSPIAGIVKDVRPGIGIVVRATGRGLRAIVTLGGPTRGSFMSRRGSRASYAAARSTSAWPARSWSSARASMPRH